jgi:hypothetical protein
MFRLHYSSVIFRVTKAKSLSSAEHVAGAGSTKFWFEILKARDHLEGKCLEGSYGSWYEGMG